MFSQNLNLLKDINYLVFDLNKLSNGLYQLVILGDEKTLQSRFVIEK